MWSRAELKQNAKNVLRNNYWMAFLVSLVAGILTGSGGSSGGAGSSAGNLVNQAAHNDPETAKAMIFVVLVMILVFVLCMGIGLAFTFFVSGPIQIGKSRYYLESR